MTWHKPTQDSFGGLGFTRWTDKAAPVKAKDKLPAPAIAPATSRPRPASRPARAAIAASQSDDQWQRMWRLKAYIRQRERDGVSYAAALAEGKRKFWPEEYDSEDGPGAAGGGGLAPDAL